MNAEKKQVMHLTILFMMLYFVSYVTRTNYGAVISEIVRAENMLKSSASLALTASAATYGAGQLISGFLGDRIEPKKLILMGLLLTITTNLLLPFCSAASQMTVIWAVNGFAQALIWPPLVRIMTSVFKKEDYDTACTVVLCAASVGTIAVYAFSPLCIYLAGWRSIFVVSALCAILMTIVWVKKCPVVSTKNNGEKSDDTQGMKMSGSVYLFTGFLLIAIAIQGTLRDGVTTWMPSYISETFQLDNKIAILTGIILPIFSIVAVQLTSALYRKFAKNELLLAGTIFATGCITSLILYFTNGFSPMLSIFLSALLTGCMHGINWIMTCIMPLKFKKYGKISFMSGLLNSFTYVGSSISVYAIAIFSEHSGWSATLLMWSGIAFVGMAICLALSKKNTSL